MQDDTSNNKLTINYIRFVGGSCISSAVDAVVGLCSRWNAGHMLIGAFDPMGIGGSYSWDVRIFYGLGVAGDARRLLYRQSGGLLTSISP